MLASFSIFTYRLNAHNLLHSATKSECKVQLLSGEKGGREVLTSINAAESSPQFVTQFVQWSEWLVQEDMIPEHDLDTGTHHLPPPGLSLTKLDVHLFTSFQAPTSA